MHAGGGANPEVVTSIIRELLGLDSPSGFDSELAERAAVLRAEDHLKSDFPYVLSTLFSIRRVRAIRLRHAIPGGIGYRREAIHVAERVFVTLSGRTFAGADPLCELLDDAGAEESTKQQVDIVILTDPPVNAKGILGFDFTGHRAFDEDFQYGFSMEDLDRLTWKTISRTYPRKFERLLVDEVAAVVTEIEDYLSVDPRELFVPLISSVQGGLRERYKSEETNTTFRSWANERFPGGVMQSEYRGLLAGFMVDVMRVADGGK